MPRRFFNSCCPVLLMMIAAAPLLAQRRSLSAGDSALVRRILLAEEQRIPMNAAIAAGAQHRDPRIRTIARRATGRSQDSAFTTRASFPALKAPPKWPDVRWRQRYRALDKRGDDCRLIRTALGDKAWPVRLRAVDVATAACGNDESLVAVLRAWVDSIPDDVSRRAYGSISWHAAAHGIVALSRLRPTDAAARLPSLAGHRQSHVRLYASRAAAVLADGMVLRRLAGDTDPNVRESAIVALSKLTGHADDSVFVAALQSNAAQVVRVAALALAGSTYPGVREAANAAFEIWANRGNRPERDVRVALLAAAGRPLSDDRFPILRAGLARHAVALALGADIRLRVTMAAASGGGSFTVKMRGDVAPITAAGIVDLAQAGYYNGHEWHRVEHDFVIQGGSPGNNEYAGSPQYFRDELGTVPHVRGTVGMSTRGHDTGDAQWFINLRDNRRLDRDYTVFAEVVEGMAVIDQILEGDVIQSISRIEVGR